MPAPEQLRVWTGGEACGLRCDTRSAVFTDPEPRTAGYPPTGQTTGARAPDAADPACGQEALSYFWFYVKGTAMRPSSWGHLYFF